MPKGVVETTLDKRLRAFLGQGRLTGQGRLAGGWPDALGASGIRDQVRATEAHELGAAPQRLPQGSRLLAEGPLALSEARQPQHPQRPPRRHLTGQRARGRKQAFPERKSNTQGAGPNAGTTRRRAIKRAGVPRTTRRGKVWPEEGWIPATKEGLRNERCSLFFSAAAIVAGRCWSRARGLLLRLHLRPQTLVRVSIL